MLTVLSKEMIQMFVEIYCALCRIRKSVFSLFFKRRHLLVIRDSELDLSLQQLSSLQESALVSYSDAVSAAKLQHSGQVLYCCCKQKVSVSGQVCDLCAVPLNIGMDRPPARDQSLPSAPMADALIEELDFPQQHERNQARRTLKRHQPSQLSEAALFCWFVQIHKSSATARFPCASSQWPI